MGTGGSTSRSPRRNPPPSLTPRSGIRITAPEARRCHILAAKRAAALGRRGGRRGGRWGGGGEEETRVAFGPRSSVALSKLRGPFQESVRVVFRLAACERYPRPPLNPPPLRRSSSFLPRVPDEGNATRPEHVRLFDTVSYERRRCDGFEKNVLWGCLDGTARKYDRNAAADSTIGFDWKLME